MVDTQASWETHSTLNIVPFLQALMSGQCSDTILNAFSDFG